MMPSEFGQPKREDPMRPHVDERRQHPILQRLQQNDDIGQIVTAVIIGIVIVTNVGVWLLSTLGIID
jgi:hypothetical protein